MTPLDLGRARIAVLRHLEFTTPTGADEMLAWIGSPHMTGTRLLFLDRDGVLNEDSPDYIKAPHEFIFHPDVPESLSKLRRKGVSIVIVSNQSGLHRGIIEWSAFWRTHDHMLGKVREAGGDILAAFYCPHRPEEHCGCRKPRPAMLLAAARLYGVHPESTFFIGDRITDLLAAVAAGARPVLMERVPCGDVDWLQYGLVEPPVRLRDLAGVLSLLDGPPPTNRPK